MKYFLKTSKFLGLVAGAMILLNSCDKPKTVVNVGDGGQTVVKVVGGGDPASIVKNPVDFVPTPTVVLAADVRRDIANNTELNRIMHVTVTDDTAAVTAADPNYVHLDPSWYTVGAGTPKTGGEGGTYDVTFAAGEFAKQIYITIPDATVLDPSSLYGLGFTITTADANGKISQSRSVVIEIGAKNNWDGVYLRQGTYSDVSAAGAGFTYGGDQQYSLVTAGAATCKVINDDLNGGIPGYIFSNAGTGSYYGSYGYVISFNPATNTISEIHNYYGDPTMPITSGGNPTLGTGPPNYAAANGRRAVLDPSGANTVLSNKDIKIKHWMLHPAVVPGGPRVFLDETWVYQGPR